MSRTQRSPRHSFALCLAALWMLALVIPGDVGAAPAKKLPLSVKAGVVDVQARQLGLRLTITTAPRARCTSQVSAGTLRFPFPEVRTSKRGIAIITWRVGAGAPRGKWTFKVRCKSATRVRSRQISARISPPAGKGKKALAEPGSVKVTSGSPVVAPVAQGPSGFGSGNGNPFVGYEGYCTWGAWEKAPWLGRGVTGNANQWASQAARAGFTVGTAPAVDSVYVRTSGSWGHVAVVTKVINATTFEVVEMNGGSRWIDINAAKTNEFNVYAYNRVKYTGSDIRFIYKPGTGPGSTGPGPGGGGPGPGGGPVGGTALLSVINGGGSTFAKFGIAPANGGFTQQTALGDTTALAAGGQNLAIINGCGAAYAKSGVAPANGGFTGQTACGDTRAVAIGASGMVAIINGCGAAYAKDAITPANGGFTQQTACGDTTAIAVGGNNLAIINGCGAAYAKSGVAPANGGFTQQTACGDARAVAIGASGTVAIINGCGAAYAKEAITPANGGFTQQTACGDTTAIAVGGNNLAIINGCGAAYAKSGVAPANGGFTQQTACGDARAVAIGASGTVAIINGCGAAYAKEAITPANGGFTQQTACGDTTAIAVG